ncbi:MAG TPA: hypothetical protein VHA56_02555 [Mucilaginibacter sp.]|nr:hypothetical protein [Mucilaginibacter sp.]
MNSHELQRRIRIWVWIFIIGLVLSGVTAFPIESELAFMAGHTSFLPDAVANWINTIYHSVKDTNSRYPWLAYGTDWLAFGHIVIATAFIGPLKDPVKNIWVIQFGMIACIMVVPLAFIAGPVRQIPFFWRLIDCCFGVFGIIPLYICYRNIRQLEQLESK